MQDTEPSGAPKTEKAGPDVTLEKLYNYKSTFICVFAQKATEFREQNWYYFFRNRSFPV